MFCFFMFTFSSAYQCLFLMISMKCEDIRIIESILPQFDFLLGCYILLSNKDQVTSRNGRV